MPAAVIAERIEWQRGITILRERIDCDDPEAAVGGSALLQPTMVSSASPTAA